MTVPVTKSIQGRLKVVYMWIIYCSGLHSLYISKRWLVWIWWTSKSRGSRKLTEVVSCGIQCCFLVSGLGRHPASLCVEHSQQVHEEFRLTLQFSRLLQSNLAYAKNVQVTIALCIEWLPCYSAVGGLNPGTSNLKQTRRATRARHNNKPILVVHQTSKFTFSGSWYHWNPCLQSPCWEHINMATLLRNTLYPLNPGAETEKKSDKS